MLILLASAHQQATSRSGCLCFPDRKSGPVEQLEQQQSPKTPEAGDDWRQPHLLKPAAARPAAGIQMQGTKGGSAGEEPDASAAGPPRPCKAGDNASARLQSYSLCGQACTLRGCRGSQIDGFTPWQASSSTGWPACTCTEVMDTAIRSTAYSTVRANSSIARCRAWRCSDD